MSKSNGGADRITVELIANFPTSNPSRRCCPKMFAARIPSAWSWLKVTVGMTDIGETMTMMTMTMTMTMMITIGVVLICST